MSDIISREYAIKRFGEDGTWLERQGVTTLSLVEAKQRAVDLLESFPSEVCEDCIWHVCNYNKVDWDADVVSKGVFDQVKWERDTALKTIEEHGIGFGERADRPTGRWVFEPKDAIELMFTKPKCSECGFESADGGNFCSNCGAKMEGGDTE